MSKIDEGFMWILLAVSKTLVHKIAEIEKEEVEIPVFHLVAKEFNKRWQHLILNH